MHFNATVIEAVGVAQGPEVMTSADIETRLAPVYQKLRLPEVRLTLMTGIEERRFWPVETLPSTISAEAGEVALQAWGGDRNSLDWIFHCGVCRDGLEPATAAQVHRALGLSPRTQFCDVSNACLGFLNGMVQAAAMLEAGLAHHILLVSGENGKPLLEETLTALLADDFLTRQSIKPWFANLTIGAGGVAMVLSHASVATTPLARLQGGVGGADSTASKLCEGDRSASGGLLMQTDAEALLQHGIALAKKTWGQLQAQTEPDFDRVICHQVGRAHQRQLLEALEIEEAKDLISYPHFGNMGSVSLPFTFAHALQTAQLQPNDRLAFLGIGSGLTCLMLEVTVETGRG